MMKKIGNIIMNGFTKVVESRHKKRIAAAAVAVVLTAAVVTTSVFNRAAQAAENADTLMGIEKLRNQFSEGEEYTVLEIVPDINAAEIGYLFDGYEPILSEWDSETMTWKSWKDILCGYNNIDERKAFIERKKKELQDYYDDQKLTDNVPVIIPNEDYEDSEEYKDGFEKVESSSYEKTGYFTPVKNGPGAYNVAFKNEKQDGAAYYKVDSDVQITTSVAEWIADDAYIYRLDGSVYVCAGTWASVKDTIPKSSEEETDDENRNDKDDGTDKEDSNDTGDDNGDGNNGNTDESGDGENEGGTDNGDGGNETGDSENEGGADNSDSNKGTGDDDTVSAQSATGTAPKNSVSKVTWLKYVGADDNNNSKSDNSGSNTATDNGQSGSSNNGSSGNGESNPSAGTSNSDDDQSDSIGGSEDDSQSGGSGDSDSGNSGEDDSENDQDGDSGNSGNSEGEDSDDPDGNNMGNGSGDFGNGKGEGSNNNDGEGTGDSGNGQDGDDNGDGDDNDDGNIEDNTDDDSDKSPDDEDKESGKESDKNPNKGNVTAQDVSKAESEKYYLVFFERAEDGEYIVDEEKYKITHAIYNNDEGETIHPRGQYNFVDDKDGENTQTYTLPGRVLYCRGVFHSNEWFKQYVINMNSENFDKFKVKVITLTPDLLNDIYENGKEGYEKGTIPDFDFLYLNSGIRTAKNGIDITGPSDENNGDEKPVSGPDNDEGSDNTGDNGGEGTTGDGDNTGDNGDEGTTGDDDGTGDNGDEGTTGDDDNTGDNSDDSDDSTTGDVDENGNDGDIGTNRDDDNTVDSGNVVDNDSTDNSTGDSATGDNANTGNSSNTVNSDNSNNSDDNINNNSYSNKSSLWKAFVSKDDSVDASKSEVSADTDTPDDTVTTTTGTKTDDNSTGNTGDAEATDSTGNEDDTVGGNDNDNTTGNTDSNGDTTGDDDNKDDSENKDNSDDTDSSNTDDVADPDKSDTPIVLYSTSTAGVDLKDNVSNLIFKTVSAKGIPCLVDGSILYGKTEGSGAIFDTWDTTKNTEVFRLAAMLCQETLEKDHTSDSKDDLLKGIVDADKNFTTEQVYCRLGNGEDSIINDNFFKYTIYKEGGEVEEGFQNVLDEIKLENLYRKSDTSGNYKPLSTNIAQAEAVRHILNYQNRRNVEPKKKIKVLEIQPALTTKAELTKEQLQKWAPGVEEVETTIMTTAEFIGKIDKINEIYDLVYIGTSKEHLNISNWVTETGKSKDNKYLGSTVFNDKDMDGLIYYNIGDKRAVYLPMSGLLDSEYKNGRTYYYNFTRYGGNDITKEKKDALISFLNGSYPVIVSDEFIEQPVTVFEDDEYAGRRATLGVGQYNEQDLLDNQIFVGANTPTKGISSIQVKKGYQITLFADDNCKGEYKTFTGDEKSLTSSRLADGQTWNNRVRSIIVSEVEDSQPVRAIDGNHIDNSSYLYEFVNTALEKNYTNFFVKGDIDEKNENGSELFKFYLNRPKASLDSFTANGTKGDSLDGKATVNDAYYIYPNTIGRYTLQYYFTIKNEGAASMDTRYYCKLYIDVNADGKFSEFEEVADIAMTNRNTGGVVSSNELYAGVPYSIVREVPAGYKGLLPWKVEVCQVNNENIYASEQGYTKLNGLDKEVLKVCQINRPGNDVINLNEEINTPGRYFNILVYGGDYNGVHYPGITNDFELEVTTITIPEYEENYSNNNDYLSDFNMLILGFSDMYGDFTGDSESGAMGAIVDFINSGKSVLMAHDTTSFFNNPIVDGTELGYTNRNDASSLKGYSNDYRFAATLNKYVRPLVGMDRYGVLTSSVVKKGVAIHEGNPDWSALMSSTKDVAYKPKSGRKETVPEAQGYTYSTISAKDKRDDGNDANLEYTRNNLNLGEMDTFRNSYVSQRFDDCYYWDNGGNNYGKDNGEMELVNNGEVWQVHVTQVNEGQITEYPYRLEDDFEVGLTHAQYYQLDYTADDDGDGQSDLVVWYCLGGRTSNSGKSETIYSQSPNDVRNNYYIYNKGNITYTGMGHASKNDRSWAVWYTFDEAKLFINTMIASYQAGVKPPTITVLDSGLPHASQLTTMYRYYDNQHEISITDLANKEDYEKVYFTVRDLNFVKGTREIETHAYYHSENTEGSGTTITVGGEEISVIRLDDLIYDPETDNLVDAYHLTSGKIYYILVHKSVLSDCEKGLDIYFEAQSTVKTNTTTENVYTTDKVYAKLQVLRAYLFELD